MVIYYLHGFVAVQEINKGNQNLNSVRQQVPLAVVVQVSLLACIATLKGYWYTQIPLVFWS